MKQSKDIKNGKKLKVPKIEDSELETEEYVIDIEPDSDF